MDAGRTITVTLTVDVSPDDSRSAREVASAVVAAIREGRPHTFGETHMLGVAVRVAAADEA